MARGITQFTCLPPTRLPTSGMSHPAFTPQPQSITALQLIELYFVHILMMEVFILSALLVHRHRVT